MEQPEKAELSSENDDSQQPILRRWFNPSFKRLSVAFYDMTAKKLLLMDNQQHANVSTVGQVLDLDSIEALFVLPNDENNVGEWIRETVADDWTVSNWTKTDNSDGGQLVKGERKVYASNLNFSYFPKCDSIETALQSWLALEKLFLSEQQKQKFSKPLHLLSTPTMTGLQYLACSLPEGKEFPPQPLEVIELLKDITPQSRVEIFTLPDLSEISEFHYYDVRFAYAASAYYELPTGLPERDSKPEFVPFSVGWYKAKITIPERWSHVGIFPTRNTDSHDSRKWLWVNEPGFCFNSVWVSQPELQLAIDNGWQVEIQERLLWQKSAPLRTWQKHIVAMREAANELPENVRSNVKDALRAFLLNAVGSMGSTKERQSYSLTPQQFLDERTEYTPEIRASIKRLDNGNIRVVKPKEKTAFRARFSQYHWAAYIWARTRATLTKGLLQQPRETLLGCRTDAVYTTCEPQGFVDNGLAGQFVCKGVLREQMNAPHTWEDLTAIRRKFN